MPKTPDPLPSVAKRRLEARERREDATLSRLVGVVEDRPERYFAQFISCLMSTINLCQKEREDLAEHIENTPRRVAKMYEEELLSGYKMNPKDILSVDFQDGYDEIVLVKGIRFYSLCAHHMLPFFGTAHVAYLPQGRVVGISKLARLVDCYGKRLQIQERLTSQVAQALMQYLKPAGAACVVEAEHLCMGCRGVNKPGGSTVTSVMLGSFRKNVAARMELLSLIGNRRNGH